MASMDTVERLARHLHEQFLKGATKRWRYTIMPTWENMAESSRQAYREVAAELLLRPPGWLRRALS